MAKPFGGMGGGAAMPRPMPNPRLNPLPTSPAPSRPGLFANIPIQKRFDMAMDLLKNGMQMGAESDSPLMAFLSPLAGAAIGGGIENKRAKLMGEQILADLGVADPTWQTAALRYFNPVGAHESGLLGEAPNGIPNNLMPYITQVALGQREFLQIFGNDYDTPDGTGVRDYLHVMDLAQGHLAALRALDTPKLLTVNLGTGQGVSVKDMVDTFARVNGVPIAHRFVARRPGDVAQCLADASQAKALLHWQTQHNLERMCADAWRWQSMNPQGFDTPL